VKKNEKVFREINKWTLENNPYLVMGGKKVIFYDNIFERFIDEIKQKYGDKISHIRKYFTYQTSTF
jgi:hypothetical protein